MGLFDSSKSPSKSVNRQRETNVTTQDDSLQDLVNEGGLQTTLKVIGSTGGRIKAISQDNRVFNVAGLSGGEVASVVDRVSQFANDAIAGLSNTFSGFVQRSDAQQATALNTLADTTRSATGTESEFGRIANKLILPALVAFGLAMFFKVIK